MTDLIILVSIVVLLPIIPAYILYKALPSGATVSGPYKGLSIQLKGAFAGYFIVALLASGFITGYPHLKPKPDYDLWTVQGKIQLEEGGMDLEGTTISIKPPEQNVNEEGRFLIENIPLPKQLGLKKPSLVINKEGYGIKCLTLETKPPAYEDLPKYEIIFDEERKDIRINTPIVLKKKPPKPKDEKPYTEKTAQEPEKTVEKNP